MGLQDRKGVGPSDAENLLVDPLVDSLLVGNRRVLLAEPESNLLLSAVDSVGTVADVTSDVDGKVTSDRSRGRGQRVGSSEEVSALLDDVLSLPDHGDDGSRGHVAGRQKRAGEVKSDVSPKQDVGSKG